MSRRPSFVAMLAALALLAAVAASAAASPVLRGQAAKHTKAMVLTLSDLSPGYGLDEGHYVTNAELKAKSSTAEKNYGKLGRITGYDASYTMLGVSGVTEIESFASIYKTGLGAHNSLILTVGAAGAHDHLTILRTKPKSLGTDTIVYHMKATGSKVDLYTVAWRRGSVFAEVIGSGLTGTVDAADVVALAKKQDTRIAKALREP